MIIEIKISGLRVSNTKGLSSETTINARLKLTLAKYLPMIYDNLFNAFFYLDTVLKFKGTLSVFLIDLMQRWQCPNKQITIETLNFVKNVEDIAVFPDSKSV